MYKHLVFVGLLFSGFVPLSLWINYSLLACPPESMCTFTPDNGFGLSWCVVQDMNSSAICEVTQACPYSTTEIITASCWLLPDFNKSCPVWECSRIRSLSSFSAIVITTIYGIILMPIFLYYIYANWKKSQDSEYRSLL